MTPAIGPMAAASAETVPMRNCAGSPRVFNSSCEPRPLVFPVAARWPVEESSMFTSEFLRAWLFLLPRFLGTVGCGWTPITLLERPSSSFLNDIVSRHICLLVCRVLVGGNSVSFRHAESIIRSVIAPLLGSGGVTIRVTSGFQLGRAMCWHGICKNASYSRRDIRSGSGLADAETSLGMAFTGTGPAPLTPYLPKRPEHHLRIHLQSRPLRKRSVSFWKRF